MRLWVIVIRGDGTTWVTDAWDDDTTYENPQGWKEAIDKARGTCEGNEGYEMRVVPVVVPGLYDVFDQPQLDGQIEEPAADANREEPHA